jgi:putative hemolysin
MKAAPSQRLFDLDPVTRHLAPPLRGAVKPALSSLLCLPELRAAYDSVKARGGDDFCKAALDCLDIEVAVANSDLARVPSEGPVIVVANHPFGGIEGLILGHLLRTVRPDVRLLANELLAQIPDMAPLCIFVDVLNTKKARRTNIRGLHQAIDWTKQGGCLAVFPGGEVSSWNMKARSVTDPPWRNHVASLIRRTGAQVVPVHFSGRNRALFHIAGLINQRLRTVLLPRELLSKQHQRIGMRIGSPIAPDQLKDFASNEALLTYLRGRTYALARSKVKAPLRRKLPVPRRRPAAEAATEAAADLTPPAELEAELNALPDDCKLAENSGLAVYRADPSRTPKLLNEVGRLREVTFREVGEGTGQAVDLDPFDYKYQHLLIWDTAERRLVGGYRLGATDELRQREDDQLYIQTLFKIKPAFFEKLGPSIELGRSFVRREYQRSYTPLMLLWRAIGQQVCQFPRYRQLMGPVTISAEYTPASQALIVDLLSRPEFRSAYADCVEPRKPFKVKHPAKRELARLGNLVDSVDHLDALIRDIEPDGKGVPILLRQYLKLGARCIAFNRDPAFSNCLDCLCVFDVLDADRRTLRRYMGRGSSDAFLAAHGET